MRPGPKNDPRVEQALELVRNILSENASLDSLRPWENIRYASPPMQGRLSATDRLSWWFRPLSDSQNPWDDYFDQSNEALSPSLIRDKLLALQTQTLSPPGNPLRALPEPGPLPGPRAALRLLLSEPEEEIIEDDAQAVVTCLYNFIHAFGQRDIDKALKYVDEDYHTLYNDQETDRLGLAHQLKSLLDSLIGWEFEISIAEIPRPILHPDAILVYAEILIDAIKVADSTQRTILEHRVCVFKRQPDKSWLILALSQV
jgi:ketosteroid isomerase-like protein